MKGDKRFTYLCCETNSSYVFYALTDVVSFIPRQGLEEFQLANKFRPIRSVEVRDAVLECPSRSGVQARSQSALNTLRHRGQASSALAPSQPLRRESSDSQECHARARRAH